MVAMPAVLTDGVKSVPLSQLRPEAWMPQDALDGGDTTTVQAVYKRVATVYRAVDIRAKAVSGMPFTLSRRGQDVTTDPDMQPLITRLRRLLYLNEASLCLCGASYWELATNRAGRNLTPFWLLPSTMHPLYDIQRGLYGFTRSIVQRTEPQPSYETHLPLDRVVYWWLPNLFAELGPGDPPAVAALGSAAVLLNMQRFTAGFFARGAIKMVLLTVEGNAKESEMQRLEAWWRRMVRGVKSAWEGAAIRANVKPMVIGEGLESLGNSTLTQDSKDDIATGMGVPHSLLFANAANYATAQQDVLNFYTFTIVPECTGVMQEPLQMQYLDKLGIVLTWAPEQLECYQAALLEQAQAVMAVVGKPVLTVNEGRKFLGLGPIQDLSPEMADSTAPTAPLLPPPPAAPPALPAPVDTAAPADAAAQKAADLARWERKAIKRLLSGRPAACAFESDWIDGDDAALIAHELTHVATPEAVKALFAKKLPEPGTGLSDAEQALYDTLKRALAAHGRATLQTIMDGGILDLTQLDAALRAALLSALTETALDQALNLAQEIGVPFDPAQFADQFHQWATTYSFDQVGNLTATTRQLLQKAMSAYQATPGMTQGQLDQLLTPAFGARRAETIAITETTRAASAATDQYQAYLGENGVATERVVRTNADERVCPICGPLNGKPESVWAAQYPDGPPFHTRCRCATTLRVVEG
jgi:phage portal protein BeeE